MNLNLKDYHTSITDELNAVSKRVRNLVHHWGEDGIYHEVVLKNVIKRFLPKRYSIGTGFVIKSTLVRGKHVSSKQIDLIIYDNNFPTFFREGDFVILTPDAVRGIIQVKANLANQNELVTYKDSNDNGKFIFEGKSDKTKRFFNGIFSFDGFDNFNFQLLKQKVRESYNSYYTQEQRSYPNNNNSSMDSNFLINHIALNQDFFLKHWNSEFNDNNPEYYSIYNLTNLSYSFFISNLMNYITDNNSVEHDNFLWYATDKEREAIATF